MLSLSQFAIAQTMKYDFVVAADGSGNFKTVQEAFNAVPDFRNKVTTIYVKNGVYKEKLNLSTSKRFVKLLGESVEQTILTYDDWAQKKNAFGEDKGTSGSSSCYIYGNDFTAENITFQNSSGPVGQAVALFVAGDKAKFINCRMLGFQDTLYTYGYASRQYYFNCYIEGTVDFIFGSSTALFENCTLFGKKNGYYTAPSTPDSAKYGYVFLNCKVTGDADANTFYLSRPWRPFAKAVFIDCFLDKQVKPEGWNNWGKESNEKTTFYAELNSKGPKSDIKERVKWAHQLNQQDLNLYQIETILSGWNPKTASN